MKAAVLYGKEDLRIEDLPPSSLKPGEVRLKVESALTCGTDLKVYKRGYHARMIQPPAVLGHEMAGTLCEVASDGARGWRVGDRVVVANSAPCGQCRHCRQGRENLCNDLLFLNGAYGESVVIPSRVVARNLLRLRDRTPFRQAALVEPLACVVLAVEESRLASEERVLILGSGPIGLMFARLARHRGCHVGVVGRGEARLNLARRLGVEETFDIGDKADTLTHERAEAIGDWDVVIEAVGKPQTWESAVALVRKGGRVNFFGGCPSDSSVRLDPSKMHYGGLELRASFHHTPRTIRQALSLIEDQAFPVDDFIDGLLPLDEVPNLFRRMAEGSRSLKTEIRMD